MVNIVVRLYLLYRELWTLYKPTYTVYIRQFFLSIPAAGVVHTSEPHDCQNTLSLFLSVVLSLAQPLTCTCLHIPSQYLARHLALPSLSEQFKWIIRLMMRRKWIVHLLISNQSPLSCSWCRIRLALCEMTPDSVRHCNTLWVPVKSGTSSLGRELFLCGQLTSSIPPAPKWDTNAMSPLSVPLVYMLICIIINKERWHAHTDPVFDTTLAPSSLLPL